MSRRVSVKRNPRGHTIAGKCFVSKDGGDTWELFTPKPRKPRVTLEYDRETGRYYVQVKR